MRPAMRTRAGTRLTAALALAVLLSLSAVLPVAAQTDPAQDDEETGDDLEIEPDDESDIADSLAGYRTQAEATPLGVLLFEPLLPFPVDPGMPHFELQSAYTRATLNTGPTGRALASTLWPGATLGDSLEQLAEGVDYPVMANARTPEGPEEEELELAPGVGMRSRADGLGVDAYAYTTDLPSDVLEVGTYESRSTSGVQDGQAIARARASAQDIALLGGIIELDGVVTDIEARGDGSEASTSGSTTVAGLRIAGFGFAVDEDGLQPEAGDAGGDLPELPFGLANRTPDELRELLGIEVELLGHDEEVAEDAAVASRAAGGLKIVIDTTVLREAALDPLLDPLVEQLPDELRNPALPDEVPINPVDLLFLESEVHLILGRAVVTANTSAPIELDFDEFGGDEVAAPPVGGGSATADAPDVGRSEDFDAAPESSSAPSPSVADGPDEGPVEDPEVSDAPQQAAPEVAEQAMEPARLPASSGGGLLATVAALAMAVLGARGLHGMTGRVFGAAGAGCDGGTGGVPNLKES